MGDPQNGWFRMEHPIRMHDSRGTPWLPPFLEPPLMEPSFGSWTRQARSKAMAKLPTASRSSRGAHFVVLYLGIPGVVDRKVYR